MTQPYSTLSIFQTNCDSFNILNCLAQTCNSLNAQNHCVVFLEPITKDNSVQKEKIKSLIEKYYIDYINKQYLSVIESEHTVNQTDVFKKYPQLLKYDWFILLDSNHVYMPNYLTDIINKYVNKHKEQYEILNIQSNNSISSDVQLLSKKHIHSIIDRNQIQSQQVIKKHIITTDCYLSAKSQNDYPYFVNDDTFCLAWLEEEPESTIQSGYSFIYKKNYKVFNIKNECHGLISRIDSGTIEITWIINSQQILHKYIANQNNIYMSSTL